MSRNIVSGGTESMGDEEKTIDGDGFRLRPLRRADLARRLEMTNDAEVQQLWVGVPADKNDMDDMESWFYLLSQGPPSEQWAVEDEAGAFIGDIDFHSIDTERREGWFTPMIGDKRYWDDDSRLRVLTTFLRYALMDKGLRKLSIQIADTDADGVRLLQRLGFRVVERVQFDYLEGVDELTMELDADDFTPH